MSWFINEVYESWDIAILNIKSADCCCFISGVSKNEAINVMQNVDLTEKKTEYYKE